MSQREIAGVLGVGHGTVERDLAAPNGASGKEIPSEDVSDGVPNGTLLKSRTTPKAVDVAAKIVKMISSHQISQRGKTQFNRSASSRLRLQNVRTEL
jgi:hypothetical protein